MLSAKEGEAMKSCSILLVFGQVNMREQARQVSSSWASSETSGKGASRCGIRKSSEIEVLMIEKYMGCTVKCRQIETTTGNKYAMYFGP